LPVACEEQYVEHGSHKTYFLNQNLFRTQSLETYGCTLEDFSIDFSVLRQQITKVSCRGSLTTTTNSKYNNRIDELGGFTFTAVADVLVLLQAAGYAEGLRAKGFSCEELLIARYSCEAARLAGFADARCELNNYCLPLPPPPPPSPPPPLWARKVVL